MKTNRTILVLISGDYRGIKAIHNQSPKFSKTPKIDSAVWMEILNLCVDGSR